MTDTLIPTLSTRCVLWTGEKNRKGYGRARVKGKKVFIHRLIFGMTYGFLPPVVMHTCDTPSCIRPSHLRAGTHQLNVKDRDAKHRQAKKLDDATIAKIVADGKWGSYPAMAKVYGVDHSRIYQILKNGGRHVIRK